MTVPRRQHLLQQACVTGLAHGPSCPVQPQIKDPNGPKTLKSWACQLTLMLNGETSDFKEDDPPNQTMQLT